MPLRTAIWNIITTIPRDINYLRNAPHFYGLRWNQDPRRIGYGAEVGVASVAVPVGGVVGNRIVDFIGDATRGIYNIGSNLADPYSIVDRPLETCITAGVVAGTMLGMAAGAKAAAWTGKKVANAWMKSRENMPAVRLRVRDHFRARGVPAAALAGATDSYMTELYS